MSAKIEFVTRFLYGRSLHLISTSQPENQIEQFSKMHFNFCTHGFLGGGGGDKMGDI